MGAIPRTRAHARTKASTPAHFDLAAQVARLGADSLLPPDKPARRARDGNAEARVQAAIVEFVRAVAPGVVIYAIPNGGLRTKAEAARMKWTGTLAGMPDLGLVLPDGRAAFLEVKAQKGRISFDQDVLIGKFVLIGVPIRVVKSIDDVREALSDWGVPTRETRRIVQSQTILGQEART